MEHVDHLLDLFDLSEQGDSPIRTLLRRPEEEDRPLLGPGDRGAVLFLDEPFSGGLDPAGLLTLKRIFQHHASAQGADDRAHEPRARARRGDRHADHRACTTARSWPSTRWTASSGMTGCRGSLGDVLERLIFPDTTREARRLFPGLHPMIGRLRPDLVAGSGDRHVLLSCSSVFEGPDPLLRMEARAGRSPI